MVKRYPNFPFRGIQKSTKHWGLGMKIYYLATLQITNYIRKSTRAGICFIIERSCSVKLSHPSWFGLHTNINIVDGASVARWYFQTKNHKLGKG
jgi:hypothetical protein